MWEWSLPMVLHRKWGGGLLQATYKDSADEEKSPGGENPGGLEPMSPVPCSGAERERSSRHDDDDDSFWEQRLWC